MKIVYVLTGGSLAGITAQVASINALEGFNIRPSAIIGTSAGSLTGAFYASGMSVYRMVKMFSSMKKSDYVDPSWFKIISSALLLGRGMTGILEGKKLYSWLKDNLPVQNIEDTKIPLAINVTNVSKQIPEILTKGELAGAVRASTSIPFVFKPHQIGDSLYVDGGAVNNVPLDEAVRTFPDADAYLIITTLTTKMTQDAPGNAWTRKPLAPILLLGRVVHAASRELSKDNLNAQGKRVGILQVNPGPISLQDVHKFSEAYDRARLDVDGKIQMVLKDINYFKS